MRHITFALLLAGCGSVNGQPDAAKKLGLPLEAIKGGKATLYPEYRQRLKELMK